MSASSAISPTPKAYSYLRFSTPEQLQGDSLRRQTAMAADYAQRHGLELDEQLTFQDLGVSGFRGSNVVAGRLGAFLEAVEAGQVEKGSFLLVESLDRISRQNVLDAQMLLTRIVMAGVTIVTLMDGRVYSEEIIRSDPTALIFAIVLFMRANEESVTKARRLKQAWENKRANLSTRPLTAICPAWLKLDRAENVFQPIPERARLMERIFELTRDGAGQHKIAETFNREGIAPWGRGKHWHRTYIAKILGNPAVIGTFTPQTLEYEGGRKVRKPLDPHEGYFPAVVSETLWKEVQALLASERAPQRGRHARNSIRNVLAGLATCPVCGGTATRVDKGKKSIPSLVCAAAKAGGGCDYRSVRYEWVETAILERLPARLRNTPAGGGSEAIDAELENIEANLDLLTEKIDNVLDAIAASPSSALSARLRKLEDELDQLRAKRDALLERRSAASGLLVGQRVERLLEALEGPLDREAINLAMRRVFDRAVVNYGEGLLEFHWTHGGTCEVPFMWPVGLEKA